MSNVYVAPPYVWMIFFFVVTYLGSVVYFWSYLRRFHNEAWVRLGSPSFLNNSPANTLRTLRFLIGSEYRALDDPLLTRTVWIIRGLFVLVLLLFFAGKFFGFVPTR